MVFAILPIKGMFYTWALFSNWASEELIFGTYLYTRSTNQITLPNHTWEYWKWQNAKRRTGSTIQGTLKSHPPQHRGGRVPASNLRQFLGRFYFTTSVHNRQGVPLCVCWHVVGVCWCGRYVSSPQYREDPDDDSVEHEVWGNCGS